MINTIVLSSLLLTNVYFFNNEDLLKEGLCFDSGKIIQALVFQAGMKVSFIGTSEEPGVVIVVMSNKDNQWVVLQEFIEENKACVLGRGDNMIRFK